MAGSSASLLSTGNTLRFTRSCSAHVSKWVTTCSIGGWRMTPSQRESRPQTVDLVQYFRNVPCVSKRYCRAGPSGSRRTIASAHGAASGQRRQVSFSGSISGRSVCSGPIITHQCAKVSNDPSDPIACLRCGGLISESTDMGDDVFKAQPVGDAEPSEQTVGNGFVIAEQLNDGAVAAEHLADRWVGKYASAAATIGRLPEVQQAPAEEAAAPSGLDHQLLHRQGHELGLE